MKAITEQLAQYAAYHRDSRNILSHMLGIPLIVVGAATLLSRPAPGLGPVSLSPALLVGIAAALFYLRLDIRFGLAMAVLLGLSVWAGQALAAQTTNVWLALGLGMLILGWVIQFIGHYYEGRKPAFLDDLMSLAIGPLFIVAELAFLLGLRNDLRQAIADKAGLPPRGQQSRAA